MSLPLTSKQERVWKFLRSCERSPTYREMEAALGAGRGRLSDTISALQEKGYATYIPNRARSIVAVDPGELAAYPTEALTRELSRRGISVDVQLRGCIS